MSLSKREYEEFKAAVDKVVYKYVMRDRSTIVSLITHSVDSGTEKRKLEEKLIGYVDKNVAYKLVDKSFSALDSLGIKLKSSKKRSHREDPDKEKEIKRPRIKETVEKFEERADNDLLPKIKADVKEKIEPILRQPTPGQLQAQQIKDLMAKAQATIEERKKALAIQGQSLPSISNGSVPAVPAAPAQDLVPPVASLSNSDVSSRIAQLQARIKAQLGSATALATPQLPGAAPTIPPPTVVTSGLRVATTTTTTAAVAAAAAAAVAVPANVPGLSAAGLPLAPGTALQLPPKAAGQGEQSKPTPLILDAEGRTVDISGKEVHLTLRVPTLKANIRAKKREEFKQQLLEKPIEESSESQFYDYRVPLKPFLKPKKAFKFHEQGKYIQLAQRERAKSRLEKLQEQISQVAKKTGISSAAKLAQLEQRERGSSSNVTPDVEWWDAVILEKDRYSVEGEPVKLKDDFITSLVEHPMEMKCPSDFNKSLESQTGKIFPISVFLTKKERKKLRRMNRRETWKEKQEKIRLGLEPPPEPKVRMANLMRVLGTEAVLDPTKMEKHVREQMAKRLKAHEDANAARKLTPDQRREKKLRKLKEDTGSGVHVTLYRVTDLSNGSHKFKIETNAKQLFMTGTVVLFKDVNVVVVEGGPKQQKKYKRLMMERIKWVEESRSKDAFLESKCQLIWEGVVQERSFGEMLFKACPSENFARDHFKKHGVEHYWDLAYGKKVLEEAEDGL